MSLHRFPNAERHSEVDVIIPECRTAFALQIRNLCRSPLNFSSLLARASLVCFGSVLLFSLLVSLLVTVIFAIVLPIMINN